jgi:hypothetical protein
MNMHALFWLENLNGRDHSEELGVEVKTVLEWMLGKYGGEGADWIYLAQDWTNGGPL